MRRLAAFCLATLALSAGAAFAAPGAALAMLGKLQRGQWSITFEDGAPARSICLRDPAQLLQLRHARSVCSRFVVEDAPDKVTVQYTCRGDGFGRTSIRRETNSLVQIESQGVEGGRPFEFRAEARRTGACR